MMNDQEQDKLYCPYCGSQHLTADKKGFGAGKALTGAILTGGVGLLAGFIGSGKVKVTCLKCGCKWNAGQLRTTPLPPKPKVVEGSSEDDNQGCAIISVVALVIFVIAALASC